jgi:hypothetical protein
MGSSEQIVVGIHLLPLFSKRLVLDLNIDKPMIHLGEKTSKSEEIVKKEKSLIPKKFPFEINRIKIVDGELIYDSKKLFINLLKCNIRSFTKSGKTIYKLTSPHMKIIFPFNKKERKVEGNLLCEFRHQLTDVKITRFLWNTEDFRINMNGRYYFKDESLSLNTSIEGSLHNILTAVLGELSPQGYMEGNVNIRKKKGEELTIDGDIGYNHVALRGEAFNNLIGTINWNSQDRQINIDAVFQDDSLRTRLKVYSKPSLTRFTLENISAEKVTNMVRIRNIVPLGGVVKKGKIRIKKGIISGKVTLNPESSENLKPEGDGLPRFNLSGDVSFKYNAKIKSVEFLANNVATEYGRITSLKGDVDPTKSTNIRINGNAEINNLQYLNKYTNFFIDLDLSPWQLKRGRGTISLDLDRRGRDFYVDSHIDLHNFTSSNEPIETLRGKINKKESITSGTFWISDKDLKGSAQLLIDKEVFTIDFKEIQGESKKILNILEVDLSLNGPMRGDFHLIKGKNSSFPEITGQFVGERINFYNYIFNDLKGNLKYSDSITLSDLDYIYNDGRGTANIFINFIKEKYSLDGQIKNLNVNRLNQEFVGTCDLSFRGEGLFEVDPIKFSVNSDNIYIYEDRIFKLRGKGDIFTDFSNFRINSRGDILYSETTSPFSFILNKTHESYTGSFKLSLSDINLLIPWGNNIGTMELDGQIFSNGEEELRTEGHAVFNGKILSFPGFPHVLENFQGDLIFKDLSFTLRQLKGTMGGGEVESSGYLVIRENQLEDIFLSLSGQNMDLYPMDRTSFSMDADLNLKYINKKLLLSGDLDISSGIWRREIDEEVSFSTVPSFSSSGSKVLDMLEFDLRLSGSKDILVNNSFIQSGVEFDLKLTGNPDFPILLGSIDCLEGNINFADKKFNVIKGKLLFNNKFMNDPLIRIESENFVKNYRIKFNIYGNPTRPRVELQSSPNLSQLDILTLLNVGELFERPSSTELRTRAGVATTSLIANQITKPIKKLAGKVFGDFLLNIDPRISNVAEVSDSRLIIGKEISKNFMVFFATKFSNQRQQPVVYFQYHLTPAVSLIGMKNEEGRYSVDIRFRKRH